jgi:FtsH-binding integral membrane protein
MGLVALTLGCLALGAYIGRDLSGGLGILFFLGRLACTFGLSIAFARGAEQLATTLFFGLGLLLTGARSRTELVREGRSSALWHAAGTTAGFVAVLGTIGYATRRDLASWYRVLFWALLALLVFGIVAIFVSIPTASLIGSVARDLRRIHDPRLQPAAGRGCRERGADRSEHLPGRLQRVPVRASAVGSGDQGARPGSSRARHAD